MEAVNPLLAKIGRCLIEAIAAHANHDRTNVEDALDRADRLGSRLIDAVGGISAMGTRIGDTAMMLFTEIEIIEVDAPRGTLMDALGRAIALTITVRQIANGPNPFEREPGVDFAEDDLTPVVPPGAIVRA